MANYCSNYIQIAGENLAIVRELFSEGSTLFYNDFLDVLKLDESTKVDFGTKWFEIGYLSETEDNNLFIIDGISAWSPPLGFFEKLSEIFNLSITIEYEEPGMNFGGQCIIKNGAIESDHEMSYFGYQLEYGRGLDYILEDIAFREYESMEDFWNDFAYDEDFISRLTEEDLTYIEKTINENKRLS